MDAATSIRRTKNLTREERQLVVTSLLKTSENGRLKRGAIAAVAAECKVTASTVSRVWKRAMTEAARTGSYVTFSRKNQSGRRREDHARKLEKLRSVDVAARTTFRSAAAACGMAHATLFRELKRGGLRSHVSHVKPLLNEENKTARLQFCLSHINKDSMLFDDMLNAVHVDEKIFYVTEPKRRFLLLPDEPAPTRKVRSKRFITRVMFLAAVGRPRYVKEKQQVFDGKVGIWAFVERVAAQRSSSRRPAGTIITKEVSVNKTKYRDMLTTKLLPALRERWPTNEPITIQQDNAPAHIAPEDPAFLDAVAQCGYAIRLKCQPPNSPDLNVLDLGVFNSIQAIQRKKNAGTIDELIEAVTDAFWEVPTRTVNAAFLSLQCSMDECINHAGDNDLKPRHMSKAGLEREGRLPLSIRCSERAEQILSAPSVF